MPGRALQKQLAGLQHPQTPQVLRECRVAVTGNPCPLLVLSAPCCLYTACNAKSQHFAAPLLMLLKRHYDSAAMTSNTLAWLFEGLVRTARKSRGLPAGQHSSDTATEVRQPLQSVIFMMVAAIHMCNLQTATS